MSSDSLGVLIDILWIHSLKPNLTLNQKNRTCSLRVNFQNEVRRNGQSGYNNKNQDTTAQKMPKQMVKKTIKTQKLQVRQLVWSDTTPEIFHGAHTHTQTHTNNIHII